MARKPNKLSDQIRQAIDGCGQTRYQIWQATGVPQETLCRFMAGKAGLSMPVLDKLAEHLGLRIVADKPKAKKGK
jgi:hypothetical protein